jgi:DNA invertase Pin-like site-specific DNA recombinase
MNIPLSSPMSQLSFDEKFARIRELQTAKDIANRSKLISICDGIGHAFGYTRVSTTMQKDDGSSLPAQKRTIEEYCLRNNIKLEHLYTDAALSGNDRDRPELNKMISDLIPGMKIIVTSADRFARNIAHVIKFKNEIHERKCSIVIIDSALDTSNPISDVIFNILSCFAEWERKNTKTKISAVMQDMSREGKLRHKPRYGYKLDDEKKLVMDDEEQLVIEIIRDMIKCDPKITLSSIIRYLSDKDIKIRKCARIYPTTIKNIIDANHLRDN